jgi:hypothetical protein
MKLRQRIGALVLIAAIVVVGIVVSDPAGIRRGSADSPDDDLTLVKGYGGALKVSFLSDPDVAIILADRYGLKVDITKAGSIEMLCDLPLDGMDFIWAGDQSSLAIYSDCGGTMVQSGNVYNSPVVFYSWAPLVDALVTAGIAHVESGGAYSIDFDRLLALVTEGRTWEDIGVEGLHGRITIHTTDPARSNSGYLFSGLMANEMNGGEVVTDATVDPLLSSISDIFDRLGYMEGTSGDLFEQFLTTGIGAKPIVAGYESQLLEFLLANPNYRDQVIQDVRILYPRPTVWASHPMVARTEQGAKLLSALKDPEIQSIAWEKHGNRSGVAGVRNDISAMDVPGLIGTITSVVDMPSPSTMSRILDALKSEAATAGEAGGGGSRTPP